MREWHRTDNLTLVRRCALLRRREDYTYYPHNADGTDITPAPAYNDLVFGLERRLGDLRRQPHGLPRAPWTTSSRRTSWPTCRRDGLQGRRRQSAAVLPVADADVQSRDSDGVRGRLEDQSVRPPHAVEPVGVLQQLQGHPADPGLVPDAATERDPVSVRRPARCRPTSARRT